MKKILARFRKAPYLWIGLPVILIIVICIAIFSLFTISRSSVGLGGGAPEGVSSYSVAPESAIVRFSDSVAEEAPAEPPDYYLPTAVPASSAGSSDGNAVPLDVYLANAVAQAQDTARVIIYTGDISLVVRDTREAMDNITQIAAEQGGFVSGSNVFESGDALRGSMTIRIPAERYQDTLSQLREMSLRVERESTSSQDVTEEFTDLQARKTNLEVAEKALQELLEERQRIGSTSDILEVHRELTNIRGQIEQIEGRLRYLANQAALSTITIQLTPDILYQPISVAGWEPQGVAREAVQALIVALQSLGTMVIWFVVLILPLLIILAILVTAVVWLIRWWLRRRRSRKQAPAEA